MNNPDNDRPSEADKQVPKHDRGTGSGYAEPEPRDKHDARQPDPRRRPNPDEGGLGREPETHPGAAGD